MINKTIKRSMTIYLPLVPIVFNPPDGFCQVSAAASHWEQGQWTCLVHRKSCSAVLPQKGNVSYPLRS